MTCRWLLKDSPSLLICWLVVLFMTACLLSCGAADSIKDEVQCIFVGLIPAKLCFIERHVCDQEALLSESWPGAWICVVGPDGIE